MSDFAQALIRWQRQHGRHNLPWQHTHDPYRVWLSEIMLQQTQVATVLPYYQRFVRTFPSIFDLAKAPTDAVLALWGGLGYYSRARNLHRCAQQLVSQHQGQFPHTAAALQTLPGIGASTAAAIAAFCFGQRVAIFDANVQRVMARQFAYDADLSRVAHKRALLQHTQTTLPQAQPSATLHARMVAYTQGLMDLGANVCKAKNPLCSTCPVYVSCAAYQRHNTAAYPKKKLRQKKTTEHWWLLALRSPNPHPQQPAIWLQQRQTTGIWAGLYCFPVFTSVQEIDAVIATLEAAIDHNQTPQPPTQLRHILTHKILHLHIVSITLNSPTPKLPLAGSWHTNWRTLGLPAPIFKWLQQQL